MNPSPTSSILTSPVTLFQTLRARNRIRREINNHSTPNPDTPLTQSIFDQWPPSYVEILQWRQQKLRQFQKNPELVAAAHNFYKTHPLEFILHWTNTYDPRNISTDLPASLPFILFPRQRLLIEFFEFLLHNKYDGLVRKSRDMGATWAAAAYAVHLWLFQPGASIGFGSRKEVLVDHIGNLDSIFEKIRSLIRQLPPPFVPASLDPNTHMGYMRIINPQNQATITGEAGSNLGRGGRKSLYFLDEAAHIQRPEQTEASLGDTTDVRVDISSVAGVGNVFHRKHDSGTPYTPRDPHTPHTQPLPPKGSTIVFDLLWHHHPNKTPEWYNARRNKALREGLIQKFREEIDADFYSSQEGTIIAYPWVTSALNAHLNPLLLDPDDPLRTPPLIKGPLTAGLDIADSGNDRNALAIRRGNTLIHIESWTEQDTAYTARRAASILRAFSTPADPVICWYDVIGVGSGVKAETNRLREASILPLHVRFRPWNAASSPRDPQKHIVPHDRDSPLNENIFQNLKAQAWWSARRRFESTHAHLNDDSPYPLDQLVSIETRNLSTEVLSELNKELSQPTFGQSQSLKMVVNKTPEGTRSPNLADAVIMAFFPAEYSSYTLDNL